MKWCRVAIIKKRIDDIRKTFEIFSSYISDLEKQKSTNFKLIFFQGMSNRFGHCWHEPTVICTLYDVEPNEVLIIEVKKPFSEFCNKIHTEPTQRQDLLDSDLLYLRALLLFSLW